MQRATALVGNLPRALRLVWSAAPGWTSAWAGLLLLQGLLPVLGVSLTRPLINALATVVTQGSDWASVRSALLPLILVAGVMLLSSVLQSMVGWVSSVQADLVTNRISGLVHAKSVEVDLAFYDSSDYYDQMHRARDEAASKPLSLLENLGGLTQNGITLAGMALILLPYGLWVPLALLLSTLPAFAVVYRYNQRYHQWWVRKTPDRRRAAYYDWLLTSGINMAELRLFGLGRYFQQAFQNIRSQLVDERHRMLRDQMLAQVFSNLVGLLVGGASLGWMVWQAALGTVTLGDLALFYQAFDRGQGLMRSLLANAGQIYASSLFLSNLFAFLDLRPGVLDPATPQALPMVHQHYVRFRDVTFRYPGSERATLRDFNLELPAGKLVAIVGTNGAGKSTLVKLLCRFYDPQAGVIELDGVDIRQLAQADLRRMVTVLFQTPNNYHATAAENIAFSNLAAAPGAEAIEAAARGAGAHEVIARLPQGYATHLGRWFAEGSELSGGEWQRVALARAFLRRSPIVVLDEPTSFMDVWAEAEWLDRFRNLVEGRTALIITHRFTTAMRA
ncbi:MAG: ABC transporter ATP-binding protein, partial [Oscillochloris sp.]|nr:ABC transporter ATP-binding protein [Oscillochloris sp.]